VFFGVRERLIRLALCQRPNKALQPTPLLRSTTARLSADRYADSE
jgi:hypothetical protein